MIDSSSLWTQEEALHMLENQEDEGMEGIFGARIQSGKITINVPSDVLFPMGQVHLTSLGKKVIRKLNVREINCLDTKITFLISKSKGVCYGRNI